MAEHGALATLKDLAEKEVEDAARLLGEMRRGCQQAEEQLKMLIDYQNEYRNNLNSDMSAGMPSAGSTISSLSRRWKKPLLSIASNLISGRRKLTLP